jgi:hypothetical protein
MNPQKLRQVFIVRSLKKDESWPVSGMSDAEQVRATTGLTQKGCPFGLR